MHFLSLDVILIGLCIHLSRRLASVSHLLQVRGERGEGIRGKRGERRERGERDGKRVAKEER